MISDKSFSRRWRIATLALVAGAGIVATALLIGIVLIVWKGDWTAAVEALRMNILATGLLAMAGLMGLSLIGLLVAGPLSKISGKVGGNELSVEGDKD